MSRPKLRPLRELRVLVDLSAPVVERIHTIVRDAQPSPLIRPHPEFRSRKAFTEFLIMLGLSVYEDKPMRFITWQTELANRFSEPDKA